MALFGNAFSLFLFQDQFDIVERHTQWGLDLMDKYVKFVKERTEIEQAYAKQLRYVHRWDKDSFASKGRRKLGILVFRSEKESSDEKAQNFVHAQLRKGVLHRTTHKYKEEFGMLLCLS